MDQSIDATKLLAFAGHRLKPTLRLTLKGGLRLGHYTYNERTHISPRASVGVDPGGGTSLHASAGLYRQFLPLPLLAQNEANRSLQDPAAWHFILGARKQLSGDTHLTPEVYDKEYRHFPLDATHPQVFVIDQVLSTGLYTNGSVLTDNGRGYTRGVEAVVQTKLAQDVYGLLSGAYCFLSRYRDFKRVWRDCAFDSRITFQAEGGFKPNERCEFSIRWLLGGGRTNISAYEWDELDNAPEVLEQLGLLPIFGLEMEF